MSAALKNSPVRASEVSRTRPDETGGHEGPHGRLVLATEKPLGVTFAGFESETGALPHRAGPNRPIARSPFLTCRRARVSCSHEPAVHPDQARQRLPAHTGDPLLLRDRLSFPAVGRARVRPAYLLLPVSRR